MKSKAQYTQEKLSITLVGAGNLAWNLCKQWQKFPEIEVSYWNKNPDKSAELAQIKNGTVFLSPQEINTNPQFIFICTNDAAIPETAELFRHLNSCLVHCSGSTDIDVLKRVSANCAVFYPLQTFSKNILTDWHDLPVLLEAEKQSESQLQMLAEKMSATVSIITSQQRLSIHLAAVFSCNFTNHLLSVAFRLCKENNLPFNLLHPLIIQTVEKALSTNSDPSTMQTGPAKRNDSLVIGKHLQLLKNHKTYREIYALISEDISKTV